VNADGAAYDNAYVYDPYYLSRTSFLLNREAYSGKKLEIGDTIDLPLTDGRKAKFIYASDVRGEKLLLAADDTLSVMTRYGKRGDEYETSDLRKVMQKKEKLLTPEALELMLPVAVRGNDVIAHVPILETKLAKATEKVSSGAIAQQIKNKRSFAAADPSNPKLGELTPKEFKQYEEYIIKRAVWETELKKSIGNFESIDSVRSAFAKFDKQEQSAQTPQIKAILNKIK
jgi:hypothetical protein